MGQVVKKVGLKKEPGYLYFIDKKGHVAKVKAARGKKKKRGRPTVVKEVGVEKESGYLYYVDKNGHIARAK
ncbi:hypothetical protein ACFLZN_01585, partial [Nanoarchaeota archaeon]